MTEYKTLKEIADDVGFPFDALSSKGYTFHCIAISPGETAVGWISSGIADQFAISAPLWTLAAKKVERWKLTYDINGREATGECWFHTEEKARLFIKIDNRTILSLTKHEFTPEKL